jgi:hypothetical protein
MFPDATDSNYNLNKNKAEDELFSAEADWWHNACLDPFYADWYAYTDGYRRAAGIIVNHAKLHRGDLDALIYPIIYLYRQYIELRLKNIILNGSQLIDEPCDFPKHHILIELWIQARKILEKVYRGDPKEDLNEAEKFIKQFSERDYKGDASRYPVDKQGNKSFPNLTHINIRKFSDKAEKIADLLDGASIGIDEYLAWKMDMDSEYRQGW